MGKLDKAYEAALRAAKAAKKPSRGLANIDVERGLYSTQGWMPIHIEISRRGARGGGGTMGPYKSVRVIPGSVR